MNKLIVLVILIVVPLCLIGSVAIYAVGVNNSLVRQEEGIKAVHEDMKNVHSSIFNSIKSQGLAVEKYGDMVLQAINAAIEGRYGQGGSKAAFQFLQEQNPTIDAKIMEKLQVAIEAGYNKFESTQRTKIDRLRIYKQDLRTFPRNIVASTLGFPKIDLAELSQTISTAETKKTFSTKEMETIDPFSKK